MFTDRSWKKVISAGHKIPDVPKVDPEEQRQRLKELWRSLKHSQTSVRGITLAKPVKIDVVQKTLEQILTILSKKGVVFLCNSVNLQYNATIKDTFMNMGIIFRTGTSILALHYRIIHHLVTMQYASLTFEDDKKRFLLKGLPRFDEWYLSMYVSGVFTLKKEVVKEEEEELFI